MGVLGNGVVVAWAGRECDVPLILSWLLVIGGTGCVGVLDPMLRFSAIVPTTGTGPSETSVRSGARTGGGEGG